MCKERVLNGFFGESYIFVKFVAEADAWKYLLSQLDNGVNVIDYFYSFVGSNRPAHKPWLASCIKQR